jgi:hypothetical protein
MWLALSMVSAVHAGAVVGVEHVPSGRIDLAWSSEGQQSGTLVAEGDGMLVPSLRTHAGWVTGQWGVMGGVSTARVANYTTTADADSVSVRAAIRPKVEVRRWLMDPKPGTALFFLHSGGFAVFPAVAQSEDSATEEEVSGLTEQAKEDAGRIRNLGFTAGLGAHMRWSNGMDLGLKSAVVFSRSVRSNAKTQTVSTLLRPETSLTLSYWF